MSSWSLAALLWNIPLFAWRLLWAVPAGGWRHCWKRLPLFVLLATAFTFLNLVHFTGFILDELLFRNYRKTGVKNPVFILGIPRSGTTHLHRVLANDPVFTTLQTWETLLAPSVSERYFYRGLGSLLGWSAILIGPLFRLWFRRMDSIHKLGICEPEEDFLLLMPLQGCLLLGFLDQTSNAWWSLANFHQKLPHHCRQHLLAYYHACLQKHLYFHGQELTLLSKNPSFTSALPDLQELFPDARILACSRNPLEVLPSQLSSLRPAFSVLLDGEIPEGIKTRLIRMLAEYYSLLRHHKNDLILLEMADLQADLFIVLTSVYHHLHMDMTPDLMKCYESLSLGSRSYQSKHQYGACEFTITPEEVNQFKTLWPISDSSP